MLKIKMCSPSKRRFKRAISMNATPESRDANSPSENDHALTNESVYGQWNGFSSGTWLPSDPSLNSDASSISPKQQERDNTLFFPESLSVESCESFVDALEHQPNEEPAEGPMALDSASESSFELPPPLSTDD